MENVIFLLTNPLFYVMVLFGLGSIFGFLGFILGLKAVIDVRSLQKSTHSVQYMPVDPKDLQDDWATADSALEEQNKLFKKDLEENLPELSPTEDDKKIYSF